MRNQQHKIDFIYCPGRSWSDEDLATLVEELRDIASTCFDSVPLYQCLTGERAELARNVITVARTPEGRADGFSSAVLMDVDGVGPVLHIGLTAVRPTTRSLGLTHRLMSKLIWRYITRHRYLRTSWFTNVSCLLNTLGQFGLNFDQVYPSPNGPPVPSETHRLIARAVDEKYRKPIYIGEKSTFEWETFVFRECSKTTVFRKSADDKRFHHRDPNINNFYMRLLNFEDGDELLQVGQLSVPAYIRYSARMQKRRISELFTMRR